VILSRALPNAELLLVEGIGHNAHVELGARFAELVRDFLERHEDAARV
jgi:pimeloyl-ACP methyl ester carboxylesterase